MASRRLTIPAMSSQFLPTDTPDTPYTPDTPDTPGTPDTPRAATVVGIPTISRFTDFFQESVFSLQVVAGDVLGVVGVQESTGE